MGTTKKPDYLISKRVCFRKRSQSWSNQGNSDQSELSKLERRLANRPPSKSPTSLRVMQGLLGIVPCSRLPAGKVRIWSHTPNQKCENQTSLHCETRQKWRIWGKKAPRRRHLLIEPQAVQALALMLRPKAFAVNHIRRLARQLSRMVCWVPS